MLAAFPDSVSNSFPFTLKTVQCQERNVSKIFKILGKAGKVKSVDLSNPLKLFIERVKQLAGLYRVQPDAFV